VSKRKFSDRELATTYHSVASAPITQVEMCGVR
jgi:hypothetical protein